MADGTDLRRRHVPVKSVFVLVVALGTILTVVALFTPGWRFYQTMAGSWNPAVPVYSSTTILDGLVTNNCGDNISIGQCGVSGWCENGAQGGNPSRPF